MTFKDKALTRRWYKTYNDYAGNYDIKFETDDKDSESGFMGTGLHKEIVDYIIDLHNQNILLLEKYIEHNKQGFSIGYDRLV